ncbi:MAG: hypothetical protein JXB47_10415 [Anaerolineae bacterium]|nr:hypothetical protein [Anaerolineae bacterium]
MGEQGAEIDELLKVGKQAAREGNRATARVIFQQVLDQDKRNEQALFWMASVADTVEDKQRYLRATLKVNPRNRKAKRYLDQLQQATAERDSRIVTYGILAVILLVVLAVVVVLGVLILSGGL